MTLTSQASLSCRYCEPTIYYLIMNTLITAKLKMQTTPEQFRALRQTQLAYRDALNYVSRYAFAHGKMSNQIGL
jgi:hypothetical protein